MQLGFVGIGNMGLPMAGKLLDGGHGLIVHDLRAAGHGLAVFADDGEKFGGWPGTREWVYDKGWLRDFLDVMEKLVASGEIVMSTCSEALRDVRSGGLAYLPTASYREMEGWSLPPDLLPAPA